MMTTLSFPKSGANVETPTGIANRASCRPQRAARAVRPVCLDVREHQHERDDQQYDHQRARETRVVVVVVVVVSFDAKVFFDGGVLREGTLEVYFRKASTPPTPRRIIDRAFRGSDDDTRLVVHEEKADFSAVLRRARAGRERKVPNLRQMLRDNAKCLSNRDDDDGDDDLPPLVNGEKPSRLSKPRRATVDLQKKRRCSR